MRSAVSARVLYTGGWNAVREGASSHPRPRSTVRSMLTPFPLRGSVGLLIYGMVGWYGRYNHCVSSGKGFGSAHAVVVACSRVMPCHVMTYSDGMEPTLHPGAWLLKVHEPKHCPSFKNREVVFLARGTPYLTGRVKVFRPSFSPSSLINHLG
jgi:hypothetical protein